MRTDPSINLTMYDRVLTVDEYCKAEGITQSDLARHVGVHRNQLTRWIKLGFVVHKGKLYSFRRDLTIDAACRHIT